MMRCGGLRCGLSDMRMDCDGNFYEEDYVIPLSVLEGRVSELLISKIRGRP